jgi:hypothetical protein
VAEARDFLHFPTQIAHDRSPLANASLAATQSDLFGGQWEHLAEPQSGETLMDRWSVIDVSLFTMNKERLGRT